jgi:hypothetical protein
VGYGDLSMQKVISFGPEKSIGHICFYHGYEYVYIGGNNSIYRAPISNPMEKTQYGNIRTGCRFESTFQAWKNNEIAKALVIAQKAGAL